MTTSSRSGRKAQIEHIKARPYHREIVPQGDGSWFACLEEFPGCMTVGRSAPEALAMLDDAIDGWLHVMIEDGEPIPEPFPADEYSGKFLVRVPKTLHRDVARRAAREGVSLNQYVLAVLSAAVGAGSRSRG